MSEFDVERFTYQGEVEKEAARLVREGKASRWEAWRRAQQIVMERRQKRAAERRQYDATLVEAELKDAYDGNY
jgi:hypothetical protein